MDAKNISLFGELFALLLHTELRQRTSLVSIEPLARHKGNKLITKNKTK